MGEDREIEIFYPFDSMQDVRFDDLNDLVAKLNEAIERINEHEKRIGHATRRV